MFNWQVPGRKNHTAKWYITAGIFALSLAIWGIFTQIYALSVVVVILCGVYIMLENNAPDFVDAIANENGIGIWEVFYDYGQIENFTIIFHGQVAEALRLKLKISNLRTMDIPLIDTPVADIRAFLLGYLPEGEGIELGFVDKMIDRMGL
jgi:hypothetical protein